MTKYMSSRIKRRYSIRLDSPLFAMEDGTPLTRKSLSNALRNALVAARVPNAELYKGHSFRRGGATSLARVGVADSVIKTIGRWRSHAYQLYVESNSKPCSVGTMSRLACVSETSVLK